MSTTVLKSLLNLKFNKTNKEFLGLATLAKRMGLDHRDIDPYVYLYGPQGWSAVGLHRSDTLVLRAPHCPVVTGTLKGNKFISLGGTLVKDEHRKFNTWASRELPDRVNYFGFFSRYELSPSAYSKIHFFTNESEQAHIADIPEVAYQLLQDKLGRNVTIDIRIIEFKHRNSNYLVIQYFDEPKTDMQNIVVKDNITIVRGK